MLRFRKSFNDNCHSGNVSSVLFSEITRTSKLTLTGTTRDSNLFLIEFTLMWPIMILNWFSFLSCSSPSILSLEGGLQIGVTECWEVSKVQSCIILKDRGLSFSCFAEHQNFQIWLRKFRAILPFSFVFKCKPFLPRCLSLILTFSIHFISKLERFLLRFGIVSAALPFSFQNGLDTMTWQSGRDFSIADFNRRMSSTIFLELLVVASFVPICKIKISGFFLDNWLDKLTCVSNSSFRKNEKP